MDYLPEPRDRQDLAIWNAIEARNWKQALKLVDRKMTKRNDDFTRAVKFYVLSHHQQPAERGTAAVQLMTLSKDCVTADVDALSLYDTAAKDLFPGSPTKWAETVGTLRQKAVQLYPKNEALALDCFRACFQENDLEHANLIVNTLTKQYPAKRQYIFWRLTVMALLAASPSCPEKMRGIYSKLSYQEIKKLAATSQTELQKSSESPLSARSIQTPSELQLLHRLVASEADSAEQLSFYTDPHIGSGSKISKGEWSFIRERVLLLQKLSKWEELFAYCRSLLQGARATGSEGIQDGRGGDFVVWSALIEAARNLPEEFFDKANEEVAAHIDPTSSIDKTYRRNAHLARLRLTFAGCKSGHYPLGKFETYTNDTRKKDCSIKVTAILRYFDAFGSVPAFFNDVRSAASDLNASEQIELVQLLKDSTPSSKPLKTGNITARINISKLEYLFISQEEHRRSQNPESRDPNNQLHKEATSRYISLLQNLAVDCLDQYKAALEDGKDITEALLSTDMHPADDWVIVAAMSLIRLASQHTFATGKLDTERYLQAAAILEAAWLKSKSNSEILLLLVRLYSLLGAGSLALRSYQRLGIKQIQNDTLSYVIFDRISSLHPHRVSESPDGLTLVDPSSHLESSFQLYKRLKTTIKNSSWKSFQFENYMTVFEMREVSSHLTRSISSSLSALELRRLTRLTKPTVEVETSSHGYDLLTFEPLSNQLDYSAFPNYEPSSYPSIESTIRLGPSLSETRLRVLTLLDHIAMTIGTLPEKGQPRLDRLDDMRKSRTLVAHDQALQTPDLVFTKPEAILTQVGLALSDLIDLACSPISDSVASSFEKHEDDLKALIEKAAHTIDDPLDETPTFSCVLHPIYTAHEVSTVTLSVLAWLSKMPVTKQSDVTSMLQNLKEAASSLREKAVFQGAKAKKVMDEGGWLDRIETAVFGDGEGTENKSLLVEDAIKRLIGEYGLETWAGEIVQSWRDSVAGMTLLKK